MNILNAGALASKLRKEVQSDQKACAGHTQITAKYFCEDCGHYVCEFCSNSQHRFHRVFSHSKAQEIRKQFDLISANARSKRKNLNKGKRN